MASTWQTRPVERAYSMAIVRMADCAHLCAAVFHSYPPLPCVRALARLVFVYSRLWGCMSIRQQLLAVLHEGPPTLGASSMGMRLPATVSLCERV